VWSVRADGSEPAQLTTLEGPSVATPRWHPDSALVAFAARHGGHTDVHLVRADGGPARPVASTPYEERMPAWSRDGRRLYFASNRSGSWQIWQADVSRPDAPPRRVTRIGGLAAQESADGRALYVARPDTTGLWRLPLAPDATTTDARTAPPMRTPRAAEAEQVVPDLAPLDYANWHLAPDGLYYVRRRGRRADLVFHRFATGRRRVVARLGDLPRDAALALAPSGRWGLVARLDRQASDILLVENFR
jgi:dipeptidyl aminopeptidase/acylaminoacyl peptidase